MGKKGISLSIRMVVLLMLGLIALLAFIVILRGESEETRESMECQARKEITTTELLSEDCCFDWESKCDDIVQESYIDYDCSLEDVEDVQSFFCPNI